MSNSISAPDPASSPPAALRVLLVDDEEPARWRLASLVAACPQPRAEVVGEASSVAQARVWLAGHPCDLVLLDIAMPGATGLALAEELQRLGTEAPAVIFVTAHAEHALEAFELAATDYLTKPVRRERLQASLQRVADRQVARATPPRVGAAAAPAPVDAEVLVVAERGRVLRLPLSDVLYLKAELKYVTVRTATQTLLIDESLAELEARLGPRFLRVHRNALVAKRALRVLERRAVGGDGEDDGSEAWAVQVAPLDEWLAVSRRQLPAVREALLGEGRAGR